MFKRGGRQIMKDGEKECLGKQEESRITWERMALNKDVLNKYLLGKWMRRVSEEDKDGEGK